MEAGERERAVVMKARYDLADDHDGQG